MSVTLTGNGGLFTRLGHIWGGLADIIASMGGTATARTLSGASWQTRAATIDTDGAYSPSIMQIIDGQWNYLTSWQASQSSMLTNYASQMEKIVIYQVNLDSPINPQDITSALTELIRQMRANTDSINGSSVSAGSQTTVSATGNPIIVATVKNTRGETLQMPFAETLHFTIAGDQNTGSTLRQEPMSVKGAASVTTNAYNWPSGSGTSTSISLIDAQLNNSGNVLYNSDFETYTTSNYPDDWVISVGAAGTDILRSANPYTQTYSLEILGDGSTLSTLYQSFNTPHSTTAGAGGTPYRILPSTRYALNFFIKSPSAPAAGVLRIALVDGSNNVITDDIGGSNSVSVTLSGVTTSFVAHSATFITPTNLPTTVRLQIALTTAMTSTKLIYIDDLALAPMTQLYSGGPAVAAFAGDTAAVKGDNWTIAISNTPGTIAYWMERTFRMRDKGLQLPYDDGGTETVADSLVA